MKKDLQVVKAASGKSKDVEKTLQGEIQTHVTKISTLEKTITTIKGERERLSGKLETEGRV